MSGHSDSPNEGIGGLESLFANMRQNSGRGPSNGPGNSFLTQIMGSQANSYNPQQLQSPHGYHQPFTSSSSAVPNQVVERQHERQNSRLSTVGSNPPNDNAQTATISSSNPDHTTSLLNLLKFSIPAPPQPTLIQQQSQVGQAHPTVTEHNHESYSNINRGSNELLAALQGEMGNNISKIQRNSSGKAAPGGPSSATSPAGPSISTPANTQQYLLNLLNRPKPAQKEEKPQLEDSKASPVQKASPPKGSSSFLTEVDDVAQTLSQTSIGKGSETETESNQGTPKNAIFTYVNPFDQLAASSPRKRTPSAITPSQTPAPSVPVMQILKPSRHFANETASIKRSFEGNSSELTSSPAHSKQKIESPVPTPKSSTPSLLPDGRSPIEALIGIGANGKATETVSDALSQLGGQVNKQVDEAINRAEADTNQAIIEQDLRSMLNAKTEPEFEARAQTAAFAIKQELEKKGNERVLENVVPVPVAEAVKDIIDDAAEGHLVDNWENVDDGSVKGEGEKLISVYNFPAKAFTAIVVNSEFKSDLPQFAEKAITTICKLKKEFDQVDRTLVTATNNHIIYGMSKHGGIRVVSQDDGRDLKLFSDTNDRVFNVSVSTSPDGQTETILGTGIGGTVYWATIRAPNSDNFDDSNPAMRGFALPPIQPSGEELAGGVLKTRARKSNTHPEFFAVGRGKSIHIIWPSIIMNQAYLNKGRIVDTAKYLSHRSLQINTGKAGKDFTFSQDDTIVVSLDKAGRVKFWDVRTLTKSSRTNELRFPAPEQIEPVEIKEPLLTMITTPGNEKSWPTSVMFVDKLRPFQKGGALRYLIVGMKQNHSLQLWDLALGKPVQEIHLPHGNESDAVCSVLYHAATGIIVVGHPTRNSIYFIHLSAPKYHMPKNLTQADFIEKIAKKDSTLPKVDNTAILSGMREYSFANIGELRSLDILQDPADTSPAETTPLFELYAMHSKGVMCLHVHQDTLGWNPANQVTSPELAVGSGLVSVEVLKSPPDDSASESVNPSPRGSVRSTPKETVSRDFGRKFVASNGFGDRGNRAEVKIESPVNSPNGASESASPVKSGKKKKNQGLPSRSASELTQAAAVASLTRSPHPLANATTHNGNNLSPTENTNTSSSVAVSGSKASSEPAFGEISKEALSATVKQMEGTLSAEVSRLLAASFEKLYHRVDDDKRVQAAAFDAKFDGVLRLVSATLTENVDKKLSSIVTDNIKQSVIPVISDLVLKSVNEQVGAKLNTHLKTAIPQELQRILPAAIAKSLQTPELLKSVSDSLAKSVSFKVEEQFAHVLKNSIVPVFTNLTVQTSAKIAGDVQRQAAEQIGSLQRHHQEKDRRIDQLVEVTTRLGEMIHSMATGQSAMGERYSSLARRMDELIEINQAQVKQIEALSNAASPSQGSNQAVQAPQKTQQQLMDSAVADIDEAMTGERFEEGILKWIRSSFEQEIFDGYLSGWDPSFICNFQPLLLLSVISVVSQKLDRDNIDVRLTWLEVGLRAYGAVNLDESVLDVTPSIMTAIKTALELLLMKVSSEFPKDPLLKRLTILITATKRISDRC